jgi:hypothetical protein
MASRPKARRPTLPDPSGDCKRGMCHTSTSTPNEHTTERSRCRSRSRRDRFAAVPPLSLLGRRRRLREPPENVGDRTRLPGSSSSGASDRAATCLYPSAASAEATAEPPRPRAPGARARPPAPSASRPAFRRELTPAAPATTQRSPRTFDTAKLPRRKQDNAQPVTLPRGRYHASSRRAIRRRLQRRRWHGHGRISRFRPAGFLSRVQPAPTPRRRASGGPGVSAGVRPINGHQWRLECARLGPPARSDPTPVAYLGRSPNV